MKFSCPDFVLCELLISLNFFAKRYSKKIAITGIRPGEKLHEELISPSGSLRVTLENDVYRMRPSHSEICNTASIFSYMSDDDVMPIHRLETYLERRSVYYHQALKIILVTQLKKLMCLELINHQLAS